MWVSRKTWENLSACSLTGNYPPDEFSPRKNCWRTTISVTCECLCLAFLLVLSKACLISFAHRPDVFSKQFSRLHSGSSLHWAIPLEPEVSRYFCGPVAVDGQNFNLPNNTIEEVDDYIKNTLEDELGWSRDGIIMLLHSEKTTAISASVVRWLLCRFCPQFMTGRTAMDEFQLRSQRYALTEATMNKEQFMQME
jgi:hypothetical protein